MEDILYLPAPSMGQKYRTLKDNRSYESHRNSRKSQKSLEAKKRSRTKPDHRRGLRPDVDADESVSDIETVPVPIRDDVTALRIQIPVTVEILDNWMEEEDDVVWDDGWRVDDWDQFYAYQDYLAEKREAERQLYSDWDWLSGWP